MPVFQLEAFFSLFLVTSLVGDEVSAQAVEGDWPTLYRLDGPTAGDKAGWSVAGAEDVNADGFDDVVIGAPFANPRGHIQAGSVFVLSGHDGSLLWQFDGDAVGILGKFGYAVALPGDLNADGHADVLAAAPWVDVQGVEGVGVAVVYSGLDGSVLFEFIGWAENNHFGISASGAGDVNADGVPDLIMSSKTAGGAGQAYVYSGIDGSLLWLFDGEQPADSFGSSVDGAGDVDGDGYADLVVGAVGTDPGGRSQAGTAYVFSGFDGSELYRFNGEDQSDWLGVSVAGTGDLDGDGRDDFILGAFRADVGNGRAGSVYVRSGADGHLIYRFNGERSADLLGAAVAGAGDVDGDGVPDLLAGAYGADPAGTMSGSAYLFSGRTGRLLHRFDATSIAENVGFSVASAGDVDGDGRAEVVIGAAATSLGGGKGHAFVADSRGLPARPMSAAPALTLTPQQLSAAAGLVTATMDFPSSEANIPYALLASRAGTGPTNLGGVVVPLTPDVLFNRMVTGWSPPMVQGAFGTLDADGDAQATITGHPSLSRFIGQTVWLAAVSYDPAGPTPRMATNAAALMIRP